MITNVGTDDKRDKKLHKRPPNFIDKQMKLQDAVLINNELKAKLRSLGLNKIMKHDYEC